MRLQIKVPLLVIVILIVIGIISGEMMLFFQRKASVDQFEQMAMALAGVVQGSLEQGMLTGERQPIQNAIVRIGKEEMVSAVALFSPEGKAMASSQLSDIGKIMARNEILGTLQSGETSLWTNPQNGQSELWVITPVRNKSECYRVATVLR